MIAKYGVERNGWVSRELEGVRGCEVWRNIYAGKSNFFQLIRFKVNNGELVRFWLDSWCDMRLLAYLFPSCFNVAENKRGNGKIAYD